MMSSPVGSPRMANTLGLQPLFREDDFNVQKKPMRDGDALAASTHALPKERNERELAGKESITQVFKGALSSIAAGAKKTATQFVDDEASAEGQKALKQSVEALKTGAANAVGEGFDAAANALNGRGHDIFLGARPKSGESLQPLAKLNHPEFKENPQAHKIINIAGKFMDTEAALVKGIAQKGEFAGRIVGQRVFTAVDTGLSIFTALLSLVGLGKPMEVIQKTVALVVAFIARALITVISQIAQIVPAVRMVIGTVVGIVAGVALASFIAGKEVGSALHKAGDAVYGFVTNRELKERVAALEGIVAEQGRTIAEQALTMKDLVRGINDVRSDANDGFKEVEADAQATNAKVEAAVLATNAKIAVLQQQPKDQPNLFRRVTGF